MKTLFSKVRTRRAVRRAAARVQAWQRAAAIAEGEYATAMDCLQDGYSLARERAAARRLSAVRERLEKERLELWVATVSVP